MKRALLAALAAVCLTTACGSHSSSAPTPTADPPTIACPAPKPAETLTGDAVAVDYPPPTVTNGLQPVTTICTPASGSSFVPGQTNVSCTARDSLAREATCSFQVTVLPPPRLLLTRYVAFGDSITAGEDGALSVGDPIRLKPLFIVANPYPAVLQGLLRARYIPQAPGVANQGNPGESLADEKALTPDPDTLGRFSSVVSGPYDVVLIMEGSNDARTIAKDSRVQGPALEALRQMVLDAKSRGRVPYLTTIPPANPTGSRGEGAAVVPGFNDQIRGLASSLNVPLVDVYAAFDGNLGLLSSDGLHPNQDGYNLIAQTFFDAIVKNLEEPRSSSAGHVFR